MMRQLFFLILVLTAITAAQPSAAQLADTDPKVTIDITHPEAALRGQDFPLIFTQNIIPEWHTYWANPGDSGEPMKIKWDMPEAIGSTPIKWPAPERVPYGPLINFGYKGTVSVLTHLTIPADFQGERLQAEANVSWLVCEEICIPERTTISIDVPVNEAASDNGLPFTPEFAQRLQDVKDSLPQDKDWTAHFALSPYALEPDTQAIKLSVNLPVAMADDIADDTENLRFFPYDYGLVTHAAPAQSTLVREDEVLRLNLTLPRGDMPLEGFERFRFLLDINGQAYNLTALPAAAKTAPAQPAPAQIAPDNSNVKNEQNGAIGNSSATPSPRLTPLENSMETKEFNDKRQEESGALENTGQNPSESGQNSSDFRQNIGQNGQNTGQNDVFAQTNYDPAKPAFQGFENTLFKLMGSILPAGWDVYFATFMLFAFLGGLILNLMPCVFPVLSMKALSVVKLADYSVFRLWGNGIFYTLGVLISFGLIAAVLLGLRAAGHNIGWGFQLQNPNVVILLSWLIFAVGLNLSGMFQISLGRAENAGSTLATQPGLGGAFFTGMLAALLATPCTAAFMGTALGASIILPTAQAMAIFLMLGFGLAFPYLLICLIPPLVRLLPRPGSWMETFRQFLAFPMYATAIWLVWVAVRQIGDIGLLYALGGMLTLGFGVWLMRHSKDELGDRRRPIVLILAIIFMALPLIALAFTGQHDTASSRAIQNTPYLDSRAAPPNSRDVVPVSFDQRELDRLLEETDLPVFVNMTASWCVTCLLNERTSLSSASVQGWMAQHDVVYMKGDWTNYDDHITAYLASFGRNGVPIYVFYAPPQEGGSRPAPQVLPQILTPSTVTALWP